MKSKQPPEQEQLSAHAILQILQKRNMTQRFLCEKTGIDQAVMSSMLNGRRPLTDKYIDLIEEALFGLPKFTPREIVALNAEYMEYCEKVVPSFDKWLKDKVEVKR